MGEFLKTPTFEETFESVGWRDKATCRTADPKLFFPQTGQGVSSTVKAMCAACKVNTECLAWALSHREVGIWAGTSDSDRRRGSTRRRLLAQVRGEMTA